jgi:hypothetical protein
LEADKNTVSDELEMVQDVMQAFKRQTDDLDKQKSSVEQEIGRLSRAGGNRLGAYGDENMRVVEDIKNHRGWKV